PPVPPPLRLTPFPYTTLFRSTPAPRQPHKAGCMWSCTRSSVDQASSLHRPPLHGTVHILPVCYPFRTAISFPIQQLTQRVHLLFLLRKATACTFGKTEGLSGSMFLVTYLRSQGRGKGWAFSLETTGRGVLNAASETVDLMCNSTSIGAAGYQTRPPTKSSSPLASDYAESFTPPFSPQTDQRITY